MIQATARRCPYRHTCDRQSIDVYNANAKAKNVNVIVFNDWTDVSDLTVLIFLSCPDPTNRLGDTKMPHFHRKCNRATRIQENNCLKLPQMSIKKREIWYSNNCLHFSKHAVPLQSPLSNFQHNRTAHIRHLCRKTTVFSYHRCLFKTGVKK